MRNLLIAVLLAATAAAIAPRAAAAPDRDRLLLSLAQLWGDVEYFDPRLAHSNANDWDAAAVSGIAKVDATPSEPVFADAVATMLASLHDPLAHVVPSASSSASPSAAPHGNAGIALVSPDPNALVVTVNAAALPDAGSPEMEARATAAAHAIASKRTVIVDLRQGATESSDEAANVSVLFDTTPLAASLVRGDVQLPAYRRRYYNGLTSPSLPQGENYTGGYITDDGLMIRGSAKAPARVAFLVNARSTVPDLAVALVRVGRAVVFSDGLPPSFDNGDVDELPMADGSIAEFRTSEYADAPAIASFARAVPTGGDVAAAIESWLDHNTPPSVAFAPAPQGVSAGSAAGPAAFPDEAHRIFAVFQIYNAIRYFFPYRALMNEDWNAASLRAFRDVRAANDEGAYLRAIRRYYALIHDGHGYVGGNPVGQLYGGGVPWASRYLHNRIVVARAVDPAAFAAAGVRIGDIVTAIGGEPARDAFAARLPFVNGSTPQGVAFNAVAGAGTSVFAGAPGSSVDVTLRHPGSSKTFTAHVRRVAAFTRHWRSGPIVRVLPGNVGYVDLDRLEPGNVDAMFHALASTRAIILDDRGYPLGTAWSIAPRLTAANRVRGALFEEVLALAPYVSDGEVEFKQSSRTFYQIIPPASGARYLKPTITLVDERTISQAEHTGLFFSAAGHTRFVGTPTAGANGDVTSFAIPGGLTLSFSGRGVRFADGRQLQRVGIVPDVRAEPSASDLAAGRDVVLEAGLREALRLSGAGRSETVEAIGQLRSLDRADFLAALRTSEHAVTLERLELANVGKSLPGATGAHAMTVAPLSSQEDRVASNGARVDIAPYRGKAVHIFGMIRTANAAQGGAVWARVDGTNGALSLDNMSDRMPHGTSDWQPFAIVLRVPDDATAIFTGLLLYGRGEVSVSGVTIETVPADTPPTSLW